jgi:mRNA-degrading endonuclease RelE of RelBE toxin-antitoxin system
MHVDIHEHAAEDIRRLWKTDARAASAVTAALEQVQADPDVIDKLTQHGDNQFGQFWLNVKRWLQARNKKGDLWRFRIFDTPATSHRVVYGYHWQTRQICVLAVVHKDEFDYDNLQSDLAKRIMADWCAF